MATTIPWTIMIEPPLLRGDEAIPKDAVEVPLRSVFERAGVRLRAHAPPVRLLVRRSGGRHIRTPSALVVSLRRGTKSIESRRASLRILEALAHSFFLHEVRHSVCGRGLFCPPKPSKRALR